MEHSFKVSMDKEQKELKNFYTVKLSVDMEVDRKVLEEYALRAYVVEVQSQIRPNWTSFEGDCVDKVFTKSVKLGEALFASTRGKVTQERAQEAYKNKVNQLSMVQKLRTLLDDGMIDVDMYEASVEKLFAKDEITQEEFDEAMDI